MFKREGPVAITETGNQCANDFFIFDAWEDIDGCAISEEADQILFDFELKTESLQDTLEHVPWVIINGRRSALAETNLQKAICDQIKVNLVWLMLSLKTLISSFLIPIGNSSCRL